MGNLCPSFLWGSDRKLRRATTATSKAAKGHEKRVRDYRKIEKSCARRNNRLLQQIVDSGKATPDQISAMVRNVKQKLIATASRKQVETQRDRAEHNRNVVHTYEANHVASKLDEESDRAIRQLGNVDIEMLHSSMQRRDENMSKVAAVNEAVAAGSESIENGLGSTDDEIMQAVQGSILAALHEKKASDKRDEFAVHVNDRWREVPSVRGRKQGYHQIPDDGSDDDADVSTVTSLRSRVSGIGSVTESNVSELEQVRIQKQFGDCS